MRVIGIQHRVKQSAKGEARPTRVAISEGGSVRFLELADEQAELDFVTGHYPVGHEDITDPAADISNYAARHLKWGRAQVERPEGLHLSQVRQTDNGRWQRATGVPSVYEGLRANDRIAMSLGGSGDFLAYALARKGDEVGTKVFRTPPSTLKTNRQEGKDTSEDAALLVELFQTKPEEFHEVTPRDRAIILVRESWRALLEAMKARIACEQRLRQSFIGRLFTNADGLVPEGSIEKEFDAAKASDPILQNLIEEEERRESELNRALKELDLYREVFAPVKGVGPRLAARIISAVQDIRRFGISNTDERIADLYREGAEAESQGGFAAHLGEMSGGRETPSQVPAFRYDQLARMRKFLGRNHQDTVKITRALECHQERSVIRRNGGKSRFRAFMGVHVSPQGEFVRKRSGQVANWHNDGRQALYLLVGEQFNRSPDSPWGKHLREVKEKLRRKHPTPIVANATLVRVYRKAERLFLFCGATVVLEGFEVKNIDRLYEYFRAGKQALVEMGLGEMQVINEQLKALEEEINNLDAPSGLTVTLYTPGHIHRMAVWKTATHFADWLHRAWWGFEKRQREVVRKAA